ncbi:hypothetical protein LP316_14965 [Thalassotalea sp. LPB0316]|uniref:hypothetical protein n=1 Tax=Thalassotalea sp. LPB0316 TaxID=2769490 RepID=UPI001866F004|nr:hypothetical protein [Thalassotalea sp. LPB0316]QOL25575.1 hypothetical protein LP316_14965 [Thalassotalea sp. LPB0316]
MSFKRTFLATIISPFASIIVLAFQLIKFFYSAEVMPPLDGVLWVIITSVTVTFVMVASIGFVAHSILSTFGLTHWYIYSFLGALASIYYKYNALVDSNMPNDLRTMEYLTYGLNGFLVSLTFWAIAVRTSESHKPLNKD